MSRWPPRHPRATLLLILALLAGSGSSAERPQRIVSLNVCTDAMLLDLVARERIASVTFLSLDPATSAHQARAAGLHVNHGRAEEVLPLEPDLVLAGTYTATATAQLLERLGVPVLRFAPAASLRGWLDDLQRLAATTGDQARAQRLRERVLAALPQHPPPASAPTVLSLGPGGWAAGRESLAGDVMTAAGLRNAAARPDTGQSARLHLEQILMARPQLLLLDAAPPGHPSMAHALLRHPALLRMAGAPDAPRLMRIDPGEWTCASEHTLGLLQRLADVRATLPGPR